MANADQQKILEVLGSVMRLGIPLNSEGCSVEDTLALARQAQGTYSNGIPYLEKGENWPSCSHNKRMDAVLQVDTRGLSTEPHPIYVVYRCGIDCTVIRYYARPHPSHFQEILPSDLKVQGVTRLFIPEKELMWLPSEELLQSLYPNLVEKLSTLGLSEYWGRVYARYIDSLLGKISFSDHLAGWHDTYPNNLFLPPVCSQCKDRSHLVIQMEYGDWSRSLFACPHHPTEAFYEVHK